MTLEAKHSLKRFSEEVVGVPAGVLEQIRVN